MQTLGGSQYSSFAAIAPSDSTEVNCRAIYVGGAGNLAVKQKNGTVVTFTAPPVGSIVPIALDQGQVMAATTATLLIALS